MPDCVAQELNLRIDRRNAHPIRLTRGVAHTLGNKSFPLTIAGITQTVIALVLKDFEYTLLMSRKTCHAFRIVTDNEAMVARIKPLDSVQCIDSTERETMQTQSDI